jgi:hypothetical protein
MRYQHWLVAGAICLLLLELFVKPLTAVALGLLVLIAVLLSPWRDILPRVLKSAEVPGFLKVEFREKLQNVKEDADKAGLLWEPRPEQKKQPIYELIYNDDPTLALAGLRRAMGETW